MTATSNTRPTFKNLSVTHILIVNTRGFANERDVWAIPADCVNDAENFVASNHRMWEQSYTRLVPLTDADSDLRRDAGRSLTVVDC